MSQAPKVQVFEQLQISAAQSARLTKLFGLRIEAHRRGIEVREFGEYVRELRRRVKFLEERRARLAEFMPSDAGGFVVVSDRRPAGNPKVIEPQLKRIALQIAQLNLEIACFEQTMQRSRELAGPTRAAAENVEKLLSTSGEYIDTDGIYA